MIFKILFSPSSFSLKVTQTHTHTSLPQTLCEMTLHNKDPEAADREIYISYTS